MHCSGPKWTSARGSVAVVPSAVKTVFSCKGAGQPQTKFSQSLRAPDAKLPGPCLIYLLAISYLLANSLKYHGDYFGVKKPTAVHEA